MFATVGLLEEGPSPLLLLGLVELEGRGTARRPIAISGLGAKVVDRKSYRRRGVDSEAAFSRMH
jgi:hypothetical protein